MGFFDFLRGSGKQVELKPETLKAEISEIGYNANAYEVLVDEGTVTVRGMAGSQEEREKVILALGNVEGVEKVDDQIAIAASSPLAVGDPVHAPSRFYTVQSGDNLSKIAREVYGHSNAYTSLTDAIGTAQPNTTAKLTMVPYDAWNSYWLQRKTDDPTAVPFTDDYRHHRKLATVGKLTDEEFRLMGLDGDRMLFKTPTSRCCAGS